MNQRRVGRFPWQNTVFSEACTLSPSARLVVSGLCQFMEREGTGARPSQYTLAKVTGLHRNTVQAAIAELRDAGFLLARDAGRGRGGWPSYIYEATIPDPAISTTAVPMGEQPSGRISTTSVPISGSAESPDWHKRAGQLAHPDRPIGTTIGHDPSDPYQTPDSAGPGGQHDPKVSKEEADQKDRISRAEGYPLSHSGRRHKNLDEARANWPIKLRVPGWEDIAARHYPVASEVGLPPRAPPACPAPADALRRAQ